MADSLHISILNRRSFILATLGAACSAKFLASSHAFADASAVLPFERTPHFEEAFQKFRAGATPVEGLITVDLPEIAENGNFVPITIVTESPMTDADHVRAIHILSSGNPVASVATFRLSPLNGTARVQSRMRLARSQDVIVLAEMSTGVLAIATMTVKVTIGGCQS